MKKPETKTPKPAQIKTEDEVKKAPKKKENSQKTNVKVTEKTYDFENREFQDLDPKDYGIDFDEKPMEYSKQLYLQ